MIQDKLGRLSRHITTSPKSFQEVTENERYRKAAESIRGELCSYSNGSYIKTVTNLDEAYAHGRMMIPDLKVRKPLKRTHFYDTNDERLLEPDKLLFFDMETTGLGGSGTVPFLIGFGSIKDNGFQVRQYFLPDYPDEEAMLEAVHAEINSDTIIVSYNGKAFDMPILTDRMILHRVERNLEYADHIDLLHTARRLYRRRLQHCTLTNIERNVLGFYRHDDIPGHLVPSVYFNWLTTTDTTNLDKVIEHNHNDIVSLFFLMHHIAGVRESPTEHITEPDDILSLARILEARREHTSVYRILESFADISWGYKRYDILFLQSLAFKRCGKYLEAVTLWEKIAESSAPEAFWAIIELAKYSEHRAKDFKEALKHALQAREICPTRPTLQADVQKRVNRLHRRISK